MSKAITVFALLSGVNQGWVISCRDPVFNRQLQFSCVISLIKSNAMPLVGFKVRYSISLRIKIPQY